MYVSTLAHVSLRQPFFDRDRRLDHFCCKTAMGRVAEPVASAAQSALSHIWVGKVRTRVLTCPSCIEYWWNANDKVTISYGLEWSFTTHKLKFVQVAGLKKDGQWKGWNWKWQVSSGWCANHFFDFVEITDSWGNVVAQVAVTKFWAKSCLISERLIADRLTTPWLWLGPEAEEEQETDWLILHDNMGSF